MRYNITLIMMLAVIITGCSSEDLLSTRDDDGRENVVSVTVNGVPWSEGRQGDGTRAGTPLPTIPLTKPETVGVWGLYATGIEGRRVKGSAIPNDYFVRDEAQEVTVNQDHYAYLSNYPLRPNAYGSSHTSDADLHYTVGNGTGAACSGAFPWDDTRYWFYCYAPHIVDINAAEGTTNVSVSLLRGDGTTVFDPAPSFAGDPLYADGNTPGIRYLQMEGLPSVMHSDVTLAKQYRLWSRLPAGSDNNAFGPCPNFLDDTHCLDHIYSSLQVCFALSSQYAELRYLRIKKVSILIDDKATTYTVRKDVTTPGASVEFTPLIGQKNAKPIDFIRDDFYLGKDNTPETYLPYTRAYLCPTGLITGKKINLSVTYDVYDHSGQITRSNAVATSAISIPANLNTTCCGSAHTVADHSTFLSGHNYNILIKITPDFLYVLSDSDASADVIIKAGQ